MDTRKKILTVAAKEFASKGYNKATIRNICKRARVNVASINYYFRNKESLYKKMFEFLFYETRGENVFEKRWDGSFSEWKTTIREWVEKIILDIVQENPLNQCKWKIFEREMQNPSEIFTNIYETFMKPRLSNLASHFKRALIAETSDEDIYIRVFSVISNCIFYSHDRVLINMVFPDGKFVTKNMEKIINNITDIACIGINYETRAANNEIT